MAKSKGSAKKKSSKNKSKNQLRIVNSKAGKVKEAKENPFESIWSKRKFNILGQKRKNGDTEKRHVGLSRSLAIQKRQKTLLKEYLQNSKSSTFLDKRIGENEEGLQEFDKAIMRTQREIQSKLKKKTKYNLSDDDEDDLGIGDGGYLSVRDDYEDEDPADEEDADRSLGFKNNLNHFQHRLDEEDASIGSGSLTQENRHKSKKEVMDDIISKSKFFKVQKAQEKEENEKFIEKLDQDFTSLLQSDALSTLKKPGKIEAVVTNRISSVDSMKSEEKPHEYDTLVAELALDIRARPSNRTKTSEELAQAEKEHLEQLEEERQKRMAAIEDSSDEGEDTFDDDKPRKHLNLLSGDDPGWEDETLRSEKSKESSVKVSNSDNFDNEDDDNEDDEDNDDDEEEEDKVEGVQSLKDWEQSDDEYFESDSDEEDEVGDGKLMAVEKDKNVAPRVDKQVKVIKGSEVKIDHQRGSNKQSDIPYTIDAPENFEELSALLENRSDDQIIEVIKRIRTYNAISVAAENRKKIQAFYGLLLQYFAVVANRNPLNLTMLNLLAKPLIEISSEVPYFAAICARQRLIKTRTSFCEDLKNTGKSSWPSLKTLCLLRLWCMIFPCSDFRHPVITPSVLLMSEYLMRCRVISGRDIAVGSFLCSMMLSVCKQSKRYCPEAITFMQTMLMAALSDRQIDESFQLYHLLEWKTSSPLLRLGGHVNEICSLDFLTLMDLPDDSSYFASDVFKVSLISAMVENLKAYVDVYRDLKSFPEIFSPFNKVLQELAKEDRMPEILKSEFKAIALSIENICREFEVVRRPLRYQKVKIIKTFAPKFEENFVKGRDYDPDRERAERKKLKKRLKQEGRGAARELRKDNQFLLEVKEKERAQMEAERAEKYGKGMAFLQEMEHAFKSGQMGKGRKRRR